MAGVELLTDAAVRVIKNDVIKGIAKKALLSQPSELEERLARQILAAKEVIRRPGAQERLRQLVGGNVVLMGAFDRQNDEHTAEDIADQAAFRIKHTKLAHPRRPRNIVIRPLMPAVRISHRSFLEEDARLLQSALQGASEENGIAASVDPLPLAVGTQTSKLNQNHLFGALYHSWAELEDPDTLQIYPVEPQFASSLLGVQFHLLKDGNMMSLNGDARSANMHPFVQI